MSSPVVYLRILTDPAPVVHVNTGEALAAVCGQALPVCRTSIGAHVPTGWTVCPGCIEGSK